MHWILKIIFEGVYDPESYLHALLGKPHIVQMIWLMIQHNWKNYIKQPMKSFEASYNSNGEIEFFRRYWKVSFPKPTNGININMMPFIASKNFNDTKLPGSLKCYASMIEAVMTIAYGYNNVNQSKEEGKIYFLTIQESWVDAKTSQRRPGLHTDNPGPVTIKKCFSEANSASKHSTYVASNNEGSGSYANIRCEHFWGNGMMINVPNPIGGIYMSSNVEHSCKVWNCKVEADKDSGDEAISNFGDIEHLRRFLLDEDADILEANRLYWITDRTPHESVPLEKGQFRQFFRIVTSQVSLWFVDDNTENPNGVKPDPNITKIVKGSKFNPGSLEIVESKNEDICAEKVSNNLLKKFGKLILGKKKQ